MEDCTLIRQFKPKRGWNRQGLNGNLCVPLCRFLFTTTCGLEHYPPMGSTYEYILGLARTVGLIRACDLVEQGMPRVALTRLVRRGLLTRVARGLYAIPDRPISEPP